MDRLDRIGDRGDDFVYGDEEKGATQRRALTFETCSSIIHIRLIILKMKVRNTHFIMYVH